MTPLGRYPLFQQAYLVNDLETSIRNWNALHGADDMPSIYRDMYNKGEEGFHHVGVLVHDWAAERQRLLDMGFEIACELWADNVNAAYFDTRGVNGRFTELHGDPPHILGAFATWRRAHELAEPGDDPIVRRRR